VVVERVVVLRARDACVRVVIRLLLTVDRLPRDGVRRNGVDLKLVECETDGKEKGAMGVIPSWPCIAGVA
jgi:hypothetical protein